MWESFVTCSKCYTANYIFEICKIQLYSKRSLIWTKRGHCEQPISRKWRNALFHDACLLYIGRLDLHMRSHSTLMTLRLVTSPFPWKRKKNKTMQKFTKYLQRKTIPLALHPLICLCGALWESIALWLFTLSCASTEHLLSCLLLNVALLQAALLHCWEVAIGLSVFWAETCPSVDLWCCLVRRRCCPLSVVTT